MSLFNRNLADKVGTAADGVASASRALVAVAVVAIVALVLSITAIVRTL